MIFGEQLNVILTSIYSSTTICSNRDYGNSY